MWSNKIPETPGYYWYREDGGSAIPIQVPTPSNWLLGDNREWWDQPILQPDKAPRMLGELRPGATYALQVTTAGATQELMQTVASKIAAWNKTAGIGCKFLLLGPDMRLIEPPLVDIERQYTETELQRTCVCGHQFGAKHVRGFPHQCVDWSVCGCSGFRESTGNCQGLVFTDAGAGHGCKYQAGHKGDCA